MSKNFLQPPDIVETDGPVVFFAGPIQDAPPWHYEAKEIVHRLDSKIVIASPYKEYKEGEFVYEKQVDWETFYLNLAAIGSNKTKPGAILFWLPKQISQTFEDQNEFPRAYGQTSRQEIGEWRNEKKHSPEIKLVIGIQRGFGNERYTRRRFNQVCPDVPILSSLLETCQVTVGLVNESN